MPIDYEKLKGRQFDDVRQSYGASEAILYALGIGLGRDPLDGNELPFLYERNLKVLPMMAVTLGYPGFWLKEPDTGVDWRKIVHGEQGVEWHAPLPSQGSVIGRTEIDEIIDKGPGKGALIYQRRMLHDAASERLLCTLRSTTFCRGDGGFGGPAGPTAAPHAIPDQPPSVVSDFPTSPRSALIYRLSGDLNPLHADPEVAIQAGFERPILHGLCTFGIAGFALLSNVCGFDPTRFRKMNARFSAPVFPGETLRTEIWLQTAGKASFRCRVVERDVTVLNNGTFEFEPE